MLSVHVGVELLILTDLVGHTQTKRPDQNKKQLTLTTI